MAGLCVVEQAPNSWALWPGMEGGYAGAPAVGKAALEGMSREQLVDFALRLQAQLADG